MRSYSRKPRDDINTLELCRASRDGGRWRERNAAPASCVPGSRINITAQCSAKDLIFLRFLPMSLLCLLPKYQPAVSSWFLVLSYSTPSVCPKSNMLSFSCPGVERKTFPPTHTHCFQIRLSPPFSVAAIHLSLVFQIISCPLLSLFSLFRSQCLPDVS